MVERHVRDVEAVGSSPVTSTSVTLDPNPHWVQRYLFLLCTDAWFDMAQSSHAMTLDPNPHWVQRYLFLLLSYALRNCAVRTGRRLCSGSRFYSVTLDSISHWVQRYLFLLHSYALRNCAVRTGRRLCSGSKFLCVTLDPKSLWIQRYFYVCSRTRGLRMHIFAARRCMKYIKKDAKLHFYLSDRLVSI